MATTISAFDTVMSQTTIAALKQALAPIFSFSTRFEAGGAAKGASIQVPVISGKAGTIFGGTYSGASTGTVTMKSVALDSHVVSVFDITDIQAMKLSNSAQVEAALLREAMYGVGQKAFQLVQANITQPNFAAEVISTSGNWDSDDVADLAEDADTAGWSQVGRSLVLNPAYYTALRKDDAIKLYLNSNTDSLKSGIVPNIADFRIFNAYVQSVNSIVGWAATPAALAVAVVPVEVQDAPNVAASVVTDPDTGISVTVRKFYDADSGKMYGAVEALVGSAVCQGDGLIRIVSEDESSSS